MQRNSSQVMKPRGVDSASSHGLMSSLAFDRVLEDVERSPSPQFGPPLVQVRGRRPERRALKIRLAVQPPHQPLEVNDPVRARQVEVQARVQIGRDPNLVAVAFHDHRDELLLVGTAVYLRGHDLRLGADTPAAPIRFIRVQRVTQHQDTVYGGVGDRALHKGVLVLPFGQVQPVEDHLHASGSQVVHEVDHPLTVLRGAPGVGDEDLRSSMLRHRFVLCARDAEWR